MRRMGTRCARIFSFLSSSWLLALPAAAAAPASGDVAFSPSTRLELGVVSPAVKLTGDAGDDLPGNPDDQFGRVVAMDGTTAAVGVANRQEIHVFVLGIEGWELQQRIRGADVTAGPAFGSQVDVSGDTLIASDETGVHVFVRSAGTWSFEATLVPLDANAPLGPSAVDGDLVVVGSRFADTAAGLDAGAAYVFVRSGTWSEEATLTASDAFPEDNFGDAVAISGQTIAVGASRDSNPNGKNAGAAYVFVRSGTSWSEEAMLTASDGFAADALGESIALSGDRLIAGAPNAIPGGAAYLFERSLGSWSETVKLFGSDTAGFDRFGASVDLEGDRLIVGAATTFFNNFGNAAYVFEESLGSWSEVMKLTASDAPTVQFFGSAVAISGDWAVVGDPLNNTPAGFDSGAAYAFQRGTVTWSEVVKLGGVGTASTDGFGGAADLSGRTLVIGAAHDDHALGVDAGSVYVFVNPGSGWQLQAKLVASDGEREDLFGSAVAVQGNRIAVGSPNDSHSGELRAGSVYLFERSGEAWSEVAKLIDPEPDRDDLLGSAVDVSGATVAAGVPGFNMPGIGNGDVGKVIAFVRAGDGVWDAEASLTAINFGTGDQLGSSVAIRGDVLATGALFDDSAGDNSGSVSIFERSAGVWSEIDVVFGSDLGIDDRFGEAVALDGETLVVGASRHEVGSNNNAGAVYVYERSGSSWNETAKLISDQPRGSARFGVSVGLERDLLAVGAFGDFGAATAAGATYLFGRGDTGWAREERLIADDGGAEDFFGRAVAVSEDKILIGADGADLGEASDAGAAYLFALVEALFADGFESGDTAAWTGN